MNFWQRLQGELWLMNNRRVTGRLDYLTRNWNEQGNVHDAMLEEKRRSRSHYFLISAIESAVLFLIVCFTVGVFIPLMIASLVAALLAFGFLAWCIIGDYLEDVRIRRTKAYQQECYEELMAKQGE